MPTLKSAIEAPVIRDLIADHGRAKVVTAMRLALAQTMDVMTLVMPPSRAWQDLFVEDFLIKYDTESLDDFALFLQMFRRAELHDPGKPQIYGGKVDGTILFDCWTRYLGMKAEAREGMHNLRKGDALAQITEAVNANPRMQQLSESLRAEATRTRQANEADANLRREQHKMEGVLAAEQGNSIEGWAAILFRYPYETVRNAVRRRCEELGVSYTAVCEFQIT